VAANISNGHVYVAESGNARISEFTSWGTFVKAFGWDVAPGAVNEEQEVKVSAAAGDFKLSFGASTTSDLTFQATSSQVQAALNGLPTISAGGGSVSVSGGSGAAKGGTPYVVTFNGGPLGGSNVGQLITSNGTTPLSGGEPASAATVSTRANGTPGGIGLEACTAASGCKAGVEGSGTGQLATPNGITVDPNGDVYVFERINHRVEKFDSQGRFLLTFGGEVNKTKVAEVGSTEAQRNLCTAVSGNVCGIGTVGEGNGQFKSEEVGTYIFAGPGNTIFVGDRGRIQKFGFDGSFKGDVKLPEAMATKTVQSLVVDTAGNFYLTLGKDFRLRGKRPEAQSDGSAARADLCC